jgi:hypothetical protein
MIAESPMIDKPARNIGSGASRLRSLSLFENQVALAVVLRVIIFAFASFGAQADGEGFGTSL